MEYILKSEAYRSPHGHTVLYSSSAEPEEILDVVSQALFGCSGRQVLAKSDSLDSVR